MIIITYVYVYKNIKKQLKKIENAVITIIYSVLDLDSILLPFTPLVIRAY